MSYEKQNFVSGQVLTAAQLNHIEDGIEKILPAIEEGSEKQLVSDTDGNLMWVDTTHGVTIEEVILLENYTVASKVTTHDVSVYYDEKSEYVILVDGEVIQHKSILLQSNGLYVLFTSSAASELLMFPESTKNKMTLLTNDWIGKTITIKAINKTYKKIDKNFLSTNSDIGEGPGATIINAYGSTGQASGQLSTSINRGVATGNSSVACGHSTAKGSNSFSQGESTIASGLYQSVFGKFNIEEQNPALNMEDIQPHNYVIIVGNGGYNEELGKYTRSNAHTLDWSGNAWFAGTVEGTGVIVKSSTEGSNKRFKITVDDNGTISATEIIE